MKKDFFINNRKRLHDLLEDESLMFLFAGGPPKKTNDESYVFTPNRNFYYMTGIDEPAPVLLLTKFGGEVTEHLFIEKANPTMAKWVGETITAEDAEQASGISEIHTLDQLDGFVQGQLLGRPVRHVYFDLERRTIEEADSESHKYAKKLSAGYPQLNVHNVYHDICDLRMIKQPEEVEEIREAIKVTIAGIRNLMSNSKPGMKEYELEAYFDFTLKSNGIKDFAFKTIVGSGKNGTVLHYEDNDQTAEDGSLVLLDLGASRNYYSADISHTFPVNGKYSDRQKVIYNIVLDAMRATNEEVKPGVTFAHLNDFAKNFLADRCIDIGLIKEKSEIDEYYFHSIGHMLGLDTHDVGTRRDRVLEPGMVLTIEPGLYIAEEGIGVRIEDDVLVTEDGHEVLTSDLERDTEAVETMLAKRNK